MLCKGGNHSKIHAIQLALIFCLKTKTPVNLAFLVASRVSGRHYDSSRSLPYGILLSKIWEPFFSHLSSHVPKPMSKAPINQRTLNKMGLSGNKRTADELDCTFLDDLDSNDDENECE